MGSKPRDLCLAVGCAARSKRDSFVRNTFQVSRGIPGNRALETALLKALSRTRAALQVTTRQHPAFQTSLPLFFSLSYEKEGLEYHRICSKLPSILQSFLQTSQQVALQVANAPLYCVETVIELLKQVEKHQDHPNLPWDSKSWVQLLAGIPHTTSDTHGQHQRLSEQCQHISVAG